MEKTVTQQMLSRREWDLFTEYVLTKTKTVETRRLWTARVMKNTKYIFWENREIESIVDSYINTDIYYIERENKGGLLKEDLYQDGAGTHELRKKELVQFWEHKIAKDKIEIEFFDPDFKNMSIATIMVTKTEIERVSPKYTVINNYTNMSPILYNSAREKMARANMLSNKLEQ